MNARAVAALALAAALAGCAAQPSGPVDPVAAQCRYEAEIAVQSIPNPLYAGFRMQELFVMCMRGRGR